MMKRQGLVIIAWGLHGDREPTFGVDDLPLVGVVFSLVPPLWELCCSLAMPNDGTMLGNVSGGGGVLEKTFSTAFSVFSFFFLLFFLFLLFLLFLSLPLPFSFALSLLLFLFLFLVVFEMQREIL